MDAAIPAGDDHCRIQVLVRSLGRKQPTIFNRVFERLSRIGYVEVCENPRRIVRTTFVTTTTKDLQRFGELQAHRKIFGLVGVVCVPTTNGEADAIAALGAARASYDSTKSEYHDTLVNSRCATFGLPNMCEEFFSSAELLSFPTVEESSLFENGVRDLIRSIYFVLESRRLDQSFEQLDNPTCPLLADEETYHITAEKTKTYRKKCIGRLRKQSADYAMLAGLPTVALELYQSAIEQLKSIGDLLWLGAAYEGWAAAAMILRFGDQIDEQQQQKTTMQRTVSMLPNGQVDAASDRSQHWLGTTIGHQRYRSDEGPNRSHRETSFDSSTNSVATASPASSSITSNNSATKKSLKKALAMLSLDKNQPKEIDHKEVISRLKSAIEQYERFSFAAHVELDCVFRAVNVFRYRRMYIEAETFLRENVQKCLADTFTLFDNVTKAQICMVCSAIYKSMGFHRKDAFFARLAVLFRLHVNDNEQRTEGDYRLVYPTLYKTLPGYGIPEHSKDLSICSGHVSIQVKALHEVYMSAQRAGYVEAAVRHLCYIIQVYFFHLDNANKLQMIEELKRLVRSHTKGRISLSQPLPMEQCAVILPPLQMTRFPLISDFRILPLPCNLSPTLIEAATRDIFIYSPFQDRARTKNILWVVDTQCSVSIRVQNMLPMELTIKSLTLHTEGCAFEPAPVRVNLGAFVAPTSGTETPKDGRPSDVAAPPIGEISLVGVPKSPGLLTVTGYSCEVFGVENVCALREAGVLSPIAVRVIAALPHLQLETSLPKTPQADSEFDSLELVELSLYSGEIVDHSITLRNTDPKNRIDRIRVRLQQPRVFGGHRLLEILDADDRKRTIEATGESTWTFDGLQPNEERTLKLRVFGVDPLSALATPPTASVVGHAEEKASIVEIEDFRCLISSFFAVTYAVDTADEETFERTETVRIETTVEPALTIVEWQILAGDSPETRFVVFDVLNLIDADVELHFGVEQQMIIVQSQESCRVPLLCPCCTEIQSSDFQQAADRASQIMQMQELEILRRCVEKNVIDHLRIRWKVGGAQPREGDVPVGPLFASVAFLKQLVPPPSDT